LLPLSLQPYGSTLALHSFPTRRSSDLLSWGATKPHRFSSAIHKNCITGTSLKIVPRLRFNFGIALQTERSISSDFLLLLHHRPRSEEHTSELQSRENLVCRLLLEKKKK